MSTVVFKYQKEHSKIKDVIYRPVGDITIIPRMLGESLGFKVWALIEKVPPLLGRLDVFEKYRIIFDESERKIIFEWKGK